MCKLVSEYTPFDVDRYYYFRLKGSAGDQKAWGKIVFANADSKSKWGRPGEYLTFASIHPFLFCFFRWRTFKVYRSWRQLIHSSQSHLTGKYSIYIYDILPLYLPAFEEEKSRICFWSIPTPIPRSPRSRDLGPATGIPIIEFHRSADLKTVSALCVCEKGGYLREGTLKSVLPLFSLSNPFFPAMQFLLFSSEALGVRMASTRRRKRI